MADISGISRSAILWIMDDMSQWESDLARARAERKAQESAFRQAVWMPEEQCLAAVRQTYSRLQEAAAWAIARYREAGVPGQVPGAGPSGISRYLSARIAMADTPARGWPSYGPTVREALFDSDDKDGPSSSMMRLSPTMSVTSCRRTAIPWESSSSFTR